MTQVFRHNNMQDANMFLISINFRHVDMPYDALQPLDTSTLDSPTCPMLACIFLLKRRHLITAVCLLSVSYFMNMIQKLKSFLLKSTPHLLNKVYCVIKIHCEIEIYLLIFVCFLKLYHIIKFYY